MDEAIALLDAEGPEALSMRRLATRLGVSTMSTYHHVAGKADLVDGIAERIMGAMEVPPATAPWDAAVSTMARSFRQLTWQHPSAFRVLLGRERPAALVRTEDDVVARLVAAGFEPAEALTTFRILVRFLLGSVMVEATPRRTRAELDATFEQGLEVLLAGVAARRAAGQPS